MHQGLVPFIVFHFFFFNDTANTEIYTLSLHDALPIWRRRRHPVLGRRRPAQRPASGARPRAGPQHREQRAGRDRKSTRLNSSHANISYAVFCLKKKSTKLRVMARKESTVGCERTKEVA